MNLQELVDGARESVPALKGLPDDKALALLRYAFRQVGQQLVETAEGVVEFQDLGKFKIKKIEREKEGEKVARKRVTFKASKGGKGKGKGGAKAGKGGKGGKKGKKAQGDAAAPAAE